MSSFKLIAITPLVGCDEKFSKKLIPGKTYQLYKGYSLNFSKDKTELKTAKPKSINPDPSIFKLDNGIDVNISAVVGKNGEGKSTIFELFYRAIYLMATTSDFYEQKLLTNILDDLKQKRIDAGRYLSTLLVSFPEIDSSRYNELKHAKPYELKGVPKEALLSEIVAKYKL